MVRYPRTERRSLGDLENMRIRTADGGAVPFNQVAEVKPGRGLIYLLLAVPLKSYAQPLLIMSAIPFGLIGAV